MHVKRLLAIYLRSQELQFKVGKQNRKLEMNGKNRQSIGNEFPRSTYKANTSSPWNRILFRYRIPMAVSNIVRINSDFCQHIDRFFAFLHSSVRSSSALKLTHIYNMQYIFRSLLAGMLGCVVDVFLFHFVHPAQHWSFALISSSFIQTHVQMLFSYYRYTEYSQNFSMWRFCFRFFSLPCSLSLSLPLSLSPSLSFFFLSFYVFRFSLSNSVFSSIVFHNFFVISYAQYAVVSFVVISAHR